MMTSASPTTDRLSMLANVFADAIKRNAEPARIAIPFLHILSAHPGSLEKYADLLAHRPVVGRRLKNIFTRMALQAIATVEPPALFFGDTLPQRADVLFVSHFLRESQASTGEDLYFADIPRRLQESGVSSAVALINHSRKPWRKLKGWRTGNVPRIFLNRTVGIGNEIRLARDLLKEAASLRREAKDQSDDFARDALLHAATDAGSSGSLTAMRIGEQIFELVSRLQPRAIISTYEGHGWERVAYAAARRANPSIRCIGYHHAMLFPFPDAMMRRYGPRYDPDEVLTAGTVSRDWLRSQDSLSTVPIRALGSVRTAEAKLVPAHADSSAICLILPEGLVSESVMMARCAVAAARLMPDIRFRVRLHPLLKPADIEAAASDIRSAPQNFSWSSGSLQDDLASACWALYRGTTAIVPAVLSGLKPIYLADKDSGELSFDPLGQLQSWRETASSAEQIAEIIMRDIGEREDRRQSQYDAAKTFCQACFTPVDLAVLRSAIAGSVHP